MPEVAAFPWGNKAAHAYALPVDPASCCLTVHVFSHLTQIAWLYDANA
jgi:hypothetical protein